MPVKKQPVSKSSYSSYSKMITKLDDIPTLPVIVVKINQLLQNPNSSAVDVANVLKKDQVLTAKVLKLANSSYYSIPGGVKDVQRALAFLGFNTVGQLVLGLSVFSMFSEFDNEDFSMIAFWKHALGTAVCTEMLAKRIKFSKPEETFTCGLLHDIGKLVLHEINPQGMLEIIREAKKREIAFIELEQEKELPTHAYLGDQMAIKWGLPQVIRNSIRYHHIDISGHESILDSEKRVIQMVRLANTICVKNQIGKSGDYSEGKITEDMLEPFKLVEENIPEIEEQLLKEMELVGDFLIAYR